MLEYVIVGSGFAVAAAAQPGPLQTFLLCRVAERGWRSTLPAAFSPLLSDGPIALLVMLVLGQLPGALTPVLRAAGGVLLLYLAGSALLQWRRGAIGVADSASGGPRTLLQAATVNLLNPNPYLGWSLVLGPTLLKAWSVAPVNGVVLLVSFYGTMVGALATTIVLLGTTRFLGPRGRQTLVPISALALGALGIYQLVAAVAKP